MHLYLHIPFCHRVCPYCSFYKHTPGDTPIGSFIDSLLEEARRRIASLPAWEITERWHGIYGKHSSSAIVRTEPEPGVHVRVGTGGAGMTMSFGLAEEDWATWDG